MRTFLPLSLMVAGLGTLVGCSSDEDKCPPGDTSAACRPNSGNGGSQVGTGNGGTSSTAGTGGSSQAGTGGGTGASVTRGAIIEFVPDTATATSLPFRISGTEYGIQGASFADRAPMGNTFTSSVGPGGELCVQGTYEVVPNSTSYGTYWGVDFGFNLNQSTTPTGGGADAGADAGGGGGALLPLPWDPPANVIGFSFILTGGNVGLMRFRSRPGGLADPAAETSIYCKQIPAAVKDVPTDVLFTDVIQKCWGPGPVADRAAGFDRISWNLPADVMPTQIATVNFDFCIKELRPILSAP